MRSKFIITHVRRLFAVLAPLVACLTAVAIGLTAIAPASASPQAILGFGGPVDYLDALDTYGWGITTNLHWIQYSQTGEWIKSVTGLDETGNINGSLRWYIYVGMYDDCTLFGDCQMHPYEEYQDGFLSTYYRFVDTGHLLSSGPYQWKVDHIATKNFASYWCYGSPGGNICVQMGWAMTPATLDSFHNTVVGYESPNNTNFRWTLQFDSLNYRIASTGAWAPYCPDTAFAWMVTARNSPCYMYPGGSSLGIIPLYVAYTPTTLRAQ